MDKRYDQFIKGIFALAAAVMIIAFITNFWALFLIIGIAVGAIWLLVRERQRSAELRADNRDLQRDLDRARGRRR